MAHSVIEAMVTSDRNHEKTKQIPNGREFSFKQNDEMWFVIRIFHARNRNCGLSCHYS